MERKKKERTEVEKNLRAAAHYCLQRMQKGEKINILNAFMVAERDLYLSLSSENSANGFYNRKLKLTIGDLDLKIPRVRIGRSFKPSLLPDQKNGKE